MDGRGNPYPVLQHPYWEHTHNGHPLWHVLLFVLLVLLAVAAVVYLVRLLSRPRAGLSPLVPAMGGSSAEALSIAQLRYARGEIARDEFLRMSADLGAPAGPVHAETPAVAGEPARVDAPVDAPTVADEPAAPEPPAA
jgi:uncharacterized membrane protein